MAKPLDEIKSRIARFDTCGIEVTKDYPQWVQFFKKRIIPDGFMYCTVDWEIGPDNLDKVALTQEIHEEREVSDGLESGHYTCDETHTKVEYVHHVAAPITAKYHIVNYMIKGDQLRAYGS